MIDDFLIAGGTDEAFVDDWEKKTNNEYSEQDYIFDGIRGDDSISAKVDVCNIIWVFVFCFFPSTPPV
jgi:hypothetical protein